MSRLRRAGRAGLKLVAALLTAVAVALALGTLIPRGAGETPGEDPGAHRILVLAGAIHTDIALPLEPEVARRFAFLADAGLPVERASHVVVGRGGRTFYVETPTWSDLRPGPAIGAFTGDAAVMHVALSGPLDARDGRVLDLGDRAFAALLDRIEASFLRDAQGRQVALAGAGYGPYDRFYEAEGRFHALLGCNTWTAAALREAGLRTGAWTPLPQTLLWSLDLWD